MFGYHSVVRHMKRALFLGAALLLVAACSSGSSTQSFSGCVVTASLVGSNSAQLTVTCSGGKAPYTVSSLSIGGVPVTNLTGTTTGFSGSTVLTASVSGLTNGQTGSISVYDSSAGATPQSYSFTVGGSTVLSGNTGCTISANVTGPAVNQTVVFTLSVTGSWGTAPYTFSAFSPGTNGTTTQAAVTTSSTQGTASAVYRLASTQTASVSVTDARGSLQTCSTQVTVGGGGSSSGGTSGSIACRISGNYNSDGTISFELTSDANPMDPLVVTSFDPGLNGTIVNSSGYPFIARYTSGGTKTVTASAYSSTSNASCNVTPFIFNLGSSGTGGTTSGSCPVPIQVSASSVARGTPVQISIPSNYGYTLLQLIYPTNAGVSGTFLSSYAVQVTFPYASVSAGYPSGYPLTAVLKNGSASPIACQLVQYVY